MLKSLLTSIKNNKKVFLRYNMSSIIFAIAWLFNITNFIYKVYSPLEKLEIYARWVIPFIIINLIISSIIIYKKEYPNKKY